MIANLYFSDELWKLLDEFVKNTLSHIQGFCKNVLKEVVALGITHNRIYKINQQITSYARQKVQKNSAWPPF